MVYNVKSTGDINFDNYHYSVSQKYDLGQRNLTSKKLKYLTDEIFLDLRWRQRRTIQFQTTIMFIAFLFFFRMFIHYMGQFIVLKIMGVPITKFQPEWYGITLEYAHWEFWQEIVVVLTGLLANLIVFIFSALVARLSKAWCNCFPKLFHIVICWVGIFALLDPFIVLFFDIVTLNWDNGDYFKFANHFFDIYGTYTIGAYLVILIGFLSNLLTAFIFYRWMVNHYQNGKILDLYRRLNGHFRDFFVPYDNEVSLSYLQWVIARAKRRDTVIMSEKRRIKDKLGVEQLINFITIFKIEKEILKRSRLFFKDFDGSIIEVPQKRLIVRKKDLKHLARRAEKGDVTVHGTPTRDLTTLIMNTHLVLDQGQGVNLDYSDDENKGYDLKGPKIKGRKHGVGEKSIGIIDNVEELGKNKKVRKPVLFDQE